VQLQTAAGRTVGSRTIEAASRAEQQMLLSLLTYQSNRAAGKAVAWPAHALVHCLA
jgi:hypothetical protein